MSTAVNKPTDIKAKEIDVNAKLQLFGIYSAFNSGKVPSNKQIDVALNSVLASKALSNPSNKLSADGHKLVADLRDVIEKAKLLVLVKNHGNLLQDFIWQSQQISGGQFQKPGAPVDKDTAKQHGNEALGGFRALGTLIITNGQFRKLLDDALILFRDIAGDAATNAAGKVNPTEDQLRQIDEPAPDNTWHDAPDPKGMKNQLQDKYGSKVPFGKKDAQNIAQDAQQQGQTADGKPAPGAAASTALNNISAQIPDEDKEKAKQKAKEKRAEIQGKTKDYLNDKMPQERRDIAIWRLKKMVVEIQGHQDYLQAIDTLLNLAEQYGQHSKTVKADGTGAVKDFTKQADGMLTDIKTLIERFANGTSLDDTFESIKAIYADAERDPELRGWFRNINNYIRKCLKEQGYIMQDSAKDEWDRLYDQGRYLLRDKYKKHTDRAIDNVKYVGRQFDEDEQNKAFGASVQKLFLDLGNDESGKPTFKPHLLKDMSEVILPAIFEHIRYVPIPRIEASAPQFDFIMENLVIEGDNLAPNVFEFGSDNYFRWGRKSITNKNKNKLMLAVSGVQCDLRDVSYYIKKKQGFPSLVDQGVFDLFLGGSGFSFKLQMETADGKDKNHYFKVEKVTVDVKHLNIKLKKSKHKLLFTLFKPLLLKVVKPALEKVIEAQIKQNATKVDGLAYRINEEAKRAEAAAKKDPSPENVKNIYRRYADAANKEIMQGKQKKEEVKKNAPEVKIVMTQDDSLPNLKDIKLERGITSKATEYKAEALKGDKWESPVFGLGSAKETSNVPKPPAPTRKTATPHTGTGFGTGTGTGTGNTTSTTRGFQNEVSQAFDGTNEKVNGSQGNTLGHQQGTLHQGNTLNQGTTLGQNNPVLQGTT